MRNISITFACCLFLSIEALAEDKNIQMSGFECADKFTAALQWLGLYSDYPHNIVNELKEELLKRQYDVSVYAVKCKSEPICVARPYLNEKQIVEGKTTYVSISFSFSMAVIMPPENDRTLHIDMTYTGEENRDTKTKNIQQQLAVVGSVKN